MIDCSHHEYRIYWSQLESHRFWRLSLAQVCLNIRDTCPCIITGEWPLLSSQLCALFTTCFPPPPFLKKQDFPIYLRLACHSLCSPGCTRTSASPLSSAAEVLELQPRATTSGCFLSFFKMIFKVQTCSGLENFFPVQLYRMDNG